MVGTWPNGRPVRIGVLVTLRTWATTVFKRVAAVQRRWLPVAEVAEHDGPLRIEHAGLVQLQQAALDAVRMLVDVFEEQDAAA